MLPSPGVSTVVIAVLVVAGWYLSFSAARLDRLHARVEGARSALDAQLVRRASVSLQLATSGLLDPATSLLLAGAAHEAREATAADRAAAASIDAATAGRGGADLAADLSAVSADLSAAREVAESDLTRALQAALAEPGLGAALAHDATGHEMALELGSACQRVELSRRFLNEAVRAARVVRRKRVVRYLHLAGHAPWPPTFEMDDTPPAGLLPSFVAPRVEL